MFIRDLKVYIEDNNPYNEPFSILSSSALTSDQLRLDYKNNQYSVYMTSEKATAEGVQYFNEEPQAADNFRVRWETGLRAAKRRQV
ncbi:Imm59 family immunity protein [Lactococcus sp.]|uniref:Imm59 family immunity protein n=1 Tax=Lactococcus sp. TaxID=44273 RepID=UPI002FC86C20